MACWDYRALEYQRPMLYSRCIRGDLQYALGFWWASGGFSGASREFQGVSGGFKGA